MERSVLVVHRGALGDFVLIFPLLEALAEAGYGHRILLTRSSHGRLAKALGLCETLVDCDGTMADGFFTQSPEAYDQLESVCGRIDLFIGLIDDSDGTFAAWLKSCTRSTVLVAHPRPYTTLRIHVHDYLAGIVAPIGLQIKAPSRDLWKGGLQCLLHPGSGSRQKNFDEPLFRTLQKILTPAEFLLGPAEIEEGKAWPGTPLRPSLVTDLAEVLIYAKLVVSHDSGVAHLSAYLGVPTLALFKTTDPVVWQPKGLRVRLLNKSDTSARDVIPIANELFSYNRELYENIYS